MVGAIAARWNVDGWIPHVNGAFPAVERAILGVSAVEEARWVRGCCLALAARSVQEETAAFSVATFHPGESRHQGDIRAEDGNGARGTTLDARIVQFSGYGLGYALMTSVVMSSMPMTFVLASSVFSSRYELLVISLR